MKNANGSTVRYPLAMNDSGSEFTVVMNPPVISSATPRPASMSTSVATIGWMPSTETRKPFHAPSTSETSSAKATATSTVPTPPGSGDPSMMVRATAPETAITAPTDRSIPRVAMTIVMPSATSINGALLRRMSIRAPYSSPSCIVILRNVGRATALTVTSATRAAAGQNSRCLQKVLTPHSPCPRWPGSRSGRPGRPRRSRARRSSCGPAALRSAGPIEAPPPARRR